MLSYKQWKTLNESFGGPINLGLTNPTNLGLSSNIPGIDLDEAKMKKMLKAKKKMFGGDDEGDGEMVPAKAPKDDPDVDMGDEEMDGGCKNCMKSKKKSPKKMMKSKKKMFGDTGDDVSAMMKPKMFGDDDDAGETGDDMDMDNMDNAGAEDEMDPDLEGGEDETGMDLDHDGEEGEEGEHPMHKIMGKMGKKGKKPPMPAPDQADMAAPMFSKKQSKKNMKKEAYLDNEEEWLTSIKNMMDPKAGNQKYDDGFSRYYEDALFTPIDTNNLTQAVRQEPGPGEVGFAPQQPLGGPLGGPTTESKK
jgi:hypothetical protein